MTNKFAIPFQLFQDGYPASSYVLHTTIYSVFKYIHVNKWFSSFHWQTSFLTLVAVPVVIILFKTIRKYVISWVKHLLEGVFYYGSKYIHHSIAASLSMRQYCKLQYGIETYKKLHVPSRFELSLNIDTMYVNLSLVRNNEEEKSISHYSLIQPGKRIKIMGDPGSGKSTIAKKVFRTCVQSGLAAPRISELPVFIELKKLKPSEADVQDAGKWLYNYIKEDIARNDVYEMAKCVDSYVRKTGLLVLLDGLDEVASTDYRFVEKAINGLSKYLQELSPNNTIILTVRTQYYHQIKSDFFDTFPDAIFLKPFSPSDIYDFLCRWEFRNDRETNISRIYKELTDRPTLREMCGNPLILSMYVAEDQASGGHVSPESRTEFYKKVTEELIILRRLQQTTASGISHTSLKEQRERILGEIAYRHMIDIQQPKNMLRWDDAIAVIQKVMNCDTTQAATVFSEIAKETGLITEERLHESFRFIHLTFCEFLAAFEAIQGKEDGWPQLIHMHRHFIEQHAEDRARLLEVIPFAAGLQPRISRVKSLYDVRDLDDPTLLARCFLETKLYEHESWPPFVASMSRGLTESITNLNDNWLVNLHIFNVVIKDAEAVGQHLPVQATIDLNHFYKTLIEKQKDGFKQILLSFARQDAAAVFRLAEISDLNLIDIFPELLIEHCYQTPLLGLIKEKMIQSSEAEAEKWAAILAEAALRQRIVARNMDEMPAISYLTTRIKSNKKYRNYGRKAGKQFTFLTQCFSLASGTQFPWDAYTLLNVFKFLKTPVELKLRLIAGKLLLLMGQSVAPLAILCRSVSDEATKLHNITAWMFTISLLLLLFGYLTYKYNLLTSRFFDYTFNISYKRYKSEQVYIRGFFEIHVGNNMIRVLKLMQEIRESGKHISAQDFIQLFETDKKGALFIMKLKKSYHTNSIIDD